MPILHSPGVITPGQFGPITHARFVQLHLHGQHIQRWDTFGDGDDKLNARVDASVMESLQNGAGT